MTGIMVFAVIILVVLIGAIALIIIGLREPQDSDALQDRLVEYAARGEKVPLEEIELSQPISQGGFAARQKNGRHRIAVHTAECLAVNRA